MSDVLYKMCFDRHLNRYKDANGNVITYDEWSRGVCKPKKTNNKKIPSYRQRVRAVLKLRTKAVVDMLKVWSPKKGLKDDPEEHPFSLPL